MSKFQDILPLSPVQEALLLHKQMSENDQGQLHVSCVLKGDINPSRLTDAWNEVVKKHPVLRTSIHWEKIKQPVQIIHHHKEVSIEYLPNYSTEVVNAMIASDLEEGYSLNKPDGGKLRIWTDPENKVHYVLWFCHHILLDGWSSAILLRDWVAAYDGSLSSSEYGMKQFLQWQKKEIRQGENLISRTKAFSST